MPSGVPGASVFAVIWSDIARADYWAIVEFLAETGIPAAKQAAVDIEGAAARLRTLPRRGRIVPELAAQGIQTYRELVRAPWRIVYKLDGSAVRITAVLDARRNLDDLLFARFVR